MSLVGLMLQNLSVSERNQTIRRIGWKWWIHGTLVIYYFSGIPMSDTVIQLGDLALNSAVLSAHNSMGFVSQLQSKLLFLPLEGRDALGKAQTGTGKTAAFSLPLLNKIDLSQHKPQAIIMAPTRELAIQVAAEIKNLGQNITGLKVLNLRWCIYR